MPGCVLLTLGPVVDELDAGYKTVLGVNVLDGRVARMTGTRALVPLPTHDCYEQLLRKPRAFEIKPLILNGNMKLAVRAVLSDPVSPKFP